MNMNDIWITCDVIMDDPFVVPMGSSDILGLILPILGLIFLVFVPVIGITVFAIIKLVKLIKSNGNKSNSVENEQSVFIAQEDDIEQPK